MPIERYAQMRAEMEAGRLRDEVLAYAGITDDAWTVVQHEWLEKMGAELERGRFELTNRYTQAFLERQRELTASMMDALAVQGLPPELRIAPDLGTRDRVDVSTAGVALPFVHPSATPPVTSKVDGRPTYLIEKAIENATTSPEHRADLPFRPAASTPEQGGFHAAAGLTAHTLAADLPEVLSLAQYASLCAELAVFPKSAEAIFQRYGLDTREERSAVDAAWKERLRRDPMEYGAWQEMYRRYHLYWATQGTPPAG